MEYKTGADDFRNRRLLPFLIHFTQLSPCF